MPSGNRIRLRFGDARPRKLRSRSAAQALLRFRGTPEHGSAGSGGCCASIARGGRAKRKGVGTLVRGKGCASARLRGRRNGLPGDWPAGRDAQAMRKDLEGSSGEKHPARLPISGPRPERRSGPPGLATATPLRGEWTTASLDDRPEVRMPLPARAEDAAETMPTIRPDPRQQSGDTGPGSDAGPLLRCPAPQGPEFGSRRASGSLPSPRFLRHRHLCGG